MISVDFEMLSRNVKLRCWLVYLYSVVNNIRGLWRVFSSTLRRSPSSHWIFKRWFLMKTKGSRMKRFSTGWSMIWPSSIKNHKSPPIVTDEGGLFRALSSKVPRKCQHERLDVIRKSLPSSKGIIFRIENYVYFYEFVHGTCISTMYIKIIDRSMFILR